MSDVPSTPKRKRASSPSTDYPVDGTSTDVVEGGSPRARIITKFRDLQLRNVDGLGAALDATDVPNDFALSTISQGPRKRPRFGDEDSLDEKPEIESDEESNPHSVNTQNLAHGSNQMSSGTSNVQEVTGYEAQEGQAKPKFAESTPPTKIPQSKGQAISLPKAKRSKSPPPPTHNESASSLVWHDSEITGHLMDDPDDDGVGINGLGFKPSSAIAYARAQKRKQQIAEWRARESREARQKRGERRWRGVVGTGEAKTLEHGPTSGHAAKAVRFAA